MHLTPFFSLLLLGVTPLAALASSILFHSGTIIAFKRGSPDGSMHDTLQVIRNGSVLVTDDRITSISTDAFPSVDEDTELIDISNKIITTGFIDTHRHGWQTGFKTLGSNITLTGYAEHFGQWAADGVLSAEDVYLGQLAGLYEALHGGVTTTVDHAHHTWSNETAEAGLRASVDSGARVFWSYAFFNTTNGFTVGDQVANFRALAERGVDLRGSPTTLGIAYDSFAAEDQLEIEMMKALISEFNVSVLTAHSVGGSYGFDNSPEDIHHANLLNTSLPVIVSHASFISGRGVSLMRSCNQHISITPESEMHYGHTNKQTHLLMDQASLGVDTHFTFSSDLLTQARIWLQTVRYRLYEQWVDQLLLPANNPMSVNQAFLLATRNGGLALRREDLGVLEVGAKADLLVWDGESPGMLGWADPVAAIILHANAGDIKHVLVDGKWKKRDGELVVDLDGGYGRLKERFLESARRLQAVVVEGLLTAPVHEGIGPGGFPFADVSKVDVVRGEGDGYGEERFFS